MVTIPEPQLQVLADLSGKITIIAYGNPSRGDDAVGPVLFERLQLAQSAAEIPGTISLFTDFQLQIEHILDFSEADVVIFVDASIDINQAFSFDKIHPLAGNSISTHFLDPQALLSVYESVLGKTSPEAYLLGIKAYHFELGSGLSVGAESNLRQAEDFLLSRLRS